jgi:recombination protein RecA
MVRKAKAETTGATSGKLDKAAIFDALIADTNSKFGKGSLQLLGSTAHANVQTSSTGSMVVDHILGGGLARGRVHEIFGPEASGKTSLALTAIANVQKAGGNAVLIDAEHALDPKYAKVLGVDVDKLALGTPTYAEQALDMMIEMTKSGAVDIVVLDSVAALVPKAELEGDMEQNSVGLMARIMGKALRKITPIAAESKTIVVFINQTREKVGIMFGSPETTPGGKALKFYASERIRIARKQQVKDKDIVIGTLVHVKCVKNKIAPPYQEGDTVLTFNKGIHREAELLQIAVDQKIINNKNGHYTDAETGEKLVFGKDNMVKALEDRSTGLYDKYYKLVDKIYNGVDDDNDQSDDDTSVDTTDTKASDADVTVNDEETSE